MSAVLFINNATWWWILPCGGYILNLICSVQISTPSLMVVDTQSLIHGILFWGRDGSAIAGLRLPRLGSHGCLGWLAAADARRCWFTCPDILMARLSQPRNGCDKDCSRTPEYRWQGQLKISENLAYMFGQNFRKMFGFRQALAYNEKIRSDWPTGPKKVQICSDGDIRPRKRLNSFGLANQASKTAHFVRNSRFNDAQA